MKKMIRLLFILLLSIVPCAAGAATVSFGGSRSFDVGDTFSIPVNVSTASGESMNAISATVHFPSSKLRVTSVADNGIIDLWAEKPAYSNAEGIVTFQGVAYNPGFSGVNGRVVTISFRALEAGDATLSFSDASILANDGKGSEILTAAREAAIAVRGAAKKETAPEKKTVEPTPAPARAESAPAEEEAEAPAPLFDVAAEPAPTAPDRVLRFEIPYGFLVNVRELVEEYASFIVIAVGLSGWLFFAFWLLWHRLHRFRRTLLSRIAATDADLHGELLELHDAINDEVQRLKTKESKHTLTTEERHILSRFSLLLDNMEQVKTWHLKLPRKRR